MKNYISSAFFFVSILKKNLLFSKNIETDKISVQFQIKVGYDSGELTSGVLKLSYVYYGYSPNTLGGILGEIMPKPVYFFNTYEIQEVCRSFSEILKTDSNTVTMTQDSFHIRIDVLNAEGNFNPTLWNNAYFKRLDTSQSYEHLIAQFDGTVSIIYKHEYSSSETNYIFTDNDIDKIIPVEFGVKEYIG